MSKHDKKRRHKNQEVKTKETKKISSAKKVALIVLPILAIYFGGVALFQNHFVPHTSFEGYGFSLQSPEAVAEKMQEDTENRAITLKLINGEETIKLHEAIDYVKSVTAPEKGWIDKTTPWIWPLYLVANNELKATLNVDYSEEKLNSTIDGLNAMQPENIVKPSNAHLARSGDIYEIVPENMGSEIVREKLYELLKNSVENASEEIDLVEEGCYTKPSVYSDDPSLTELYDQYKAINFQRLTLDMTGATEVLETPDIINLYEGGIASKEKIYDYVTELRGKYETYEEERPFVNHYGETIIVGTGADTYGFLMDQDETTELIYEALKTTESKELTPVWKREANVRGEDGNDIGNTYIEISIDNQALWVYLDGEHVFSTDVVTGMYDLFDTPRGVFQILDKARDVHLKGEVKLPDGKKEKWDSFVNFWMPINWGGIGMHNASWRSSFGGDIYRGGGSHGCINMTYEAAEYLYNNYGYGTPVVVW